MSLIAYLFLGGGTADRTSAWHPSAQRCRRKPSTIVRHGLPPILAVALALLGTTGSVHAEESERVAAYPVYELRPPSRDGIGKVYMGREISRVMGHRGASWLERPTREAEERTDLLIEGLPLKSDDMVVDLGAGTGYFSLPLAARVDAGRVLAVDIQPEMLAIVERRSARAGLENIETILATEVDPGIPADAADLVLMVDAYHEFSHPREVMQGVVSGLKPGGRVVLVEYRAEDPAVMIKPLHKMSAEQAIREMQAVGLEWEQTLEVLPQQHMLVFTKPRGGSPAQ